MERMFPIVEGKMPPVRRMKADGTWEEYYPEPNPDYKDPEIYETDTYIHMDKDEMYDYVTKCKACGVAFIARLKWEPLERFYCPGCGKLLKG